MIAQLGRLFRMGPERLFDVIVGEFLEPIVVRSGESGCW